MSFQAYLDNIRSKTGLTPEQFRDAARKRGMLGVDVRATQFTDWLAADYDQGLGHARALWACFKSKGWIGDEGAASTASKTKKTRNR